MTNIEDEPTICCICRQLIGENPPEYHNGHNAQPIFQGRCCTSCNYTVVVPRRLNDMRSLTKRYTNTTEDDQ